MHLFVADGDSSSHLPAQVVSDIGAASSNQRRWDKGSMLVSRRIAFALVATFLATTCQAAIRIGDDLGGPLGNYILRFSNISRSGEMVIIHGRCYSACTIVIGLIAPGKICVTPRAVLGFHAALAPDQLGRLVIDPDATRLMYGMYPKPIQDWLKFNGGLERRMIYLGGADLAKMYAHCP